MPRSLRSTWGPRTLEATTNDQGYSNIQFVQIGKYQITVTLASFQTFKATGIEVGTNQIVRQDAVLQVGGMAETVTVEAAASLLATENATVPKRSARRWSRSCP